MNHKEELSKQITPLFAESVKAKPFPHKRRKLFLFLLATSCLATALTIGWVYFQSGAQSLNGAMRRFLETGGGGNTVVTIISWLSALSINLGVLKLMSTFFKHIGEHENGGNHT